MLVHRTLVGFKFTCRLSGALVLSHISQVKIFHRLRMQRSINPNPAFHRTGKKPPAGELKRWATEGEAS